MIYQFLTFCKVIKFQINYFPCFDFSKDELKKKVEEENDKGIKENE